MNRVVISCGGTGGHLSPGIALAEGLAARGDRAVLLISRRRVDAELSGRYPGLEFVAMPGDGFSWRPGALARFLLSQAGAIRVCWRVLRRERPIAVVGFGGKVFTGQHPYRKRAGVVAESIAQLSQYEALEPGDLIMTGTPEGVAAVVRGDVMQGHVDGVGEITITVR